MVEDQSYTTTLGNALAVTPAEEQQAKPIDDGLIHLSTGVILAPKKVTPFVFQSVASQFKDPPIPRVWIEEKQREEDNPMHPAYLQAKEEAEVDRSMATIDACLALGTKLISIPPELQTPDEDDWLDDLEVVGITIDRENKRLRYRTWVKFIAAPSVDDIQLIISKVLSTIGVTEEAVARATANFQHKT